MTEKDFERLVCIGGLYEFVYALNLAIPCPKERV